MFDVPFCETMRDPVADGIGCSLLSLCLRISELLRRFIRAVLCSYFLVSLYSLCRSNQGGRQLCSVMVHYWILALRRQPKVKQYVN